MILEVRTYTLVPGAREDFVKYFEAEAIPRMRAVGMTVLGQFSSVTDPDVFAYARTFTTLEERERQYRAFYESEDWLGWMIDFAMGKEESFVVFLGDSEIDPETRDAGLSGVHSSRFTLASAEGRLVDPAGDTVVLVADHGTTSVFRTAPDVRVMFTPNGHGMTPAIPLGLRDLRIGDRVLVLGSSTDDVPIAHQIVKRPGRP